MRTERRIISSHGHYAVLGPLAATLGCGQLTAPPCISGRPAWLHNRRHWNRANAEAVFGVSVNTEAFPLFVAYEDHRRLASITESVELNGL
jgi:hypothetical protein